MASPPSSGIGCKCTLRGPGRSTMPTRKANARTGTARKIDANNATKNAIRLAAIHPQLFGHAAGRGRVCQLRNSVAGLGSGSQEIFHGSLNDLYASAVSRDPLSNF